MTWTHLHFVRAFSDCGDYRRSPFNSWCTWWSKDPRIDVLNAWRLYLCANRAALGMLILGGAKIRKDEALIGNFGVTSQAGPTDPQEKALVAQLEQLRLVQRMAPELRDAPDVMGQGSVLSDRTWTPLLNDAFIIGGAHAGHEFHVAEDSAESYFRFRKARAVFEKDKSTPEQIWMGFFRKHPELLWDEKLGNPRVFARELIGLETFGYTPQFFPEQLSFAKTGGGEANFAGYLRALEAANCRPGKRAELEKHLSRFLFGRDDAFVRTGMTTGKPS